MGRDEEWGTRRPATGRRRTRRSTKPYNDDYKDDEYDSYEEDLYRDREYEEYDEREYRQSTSRRSYEDEYGSSRSRSSEERYRDRRSRGAQDEYGSSRGRSSEERYRDSRSVDRDRRDSRSRDDGRSRSRSQAETSRSRSGSRNRGYEEDRRDRRGGYYEDDRSRRPSGGRKRKKRHWGCLIPLIILLVIILAAFLGLNYLWSRIDSADFGNSDILVNEDLPDSVTEYTKNYRTFMIFGVDSRDDSTLQSGTLADSNIIVTVNKKTGAIKLTSIYRDTYVETTEGEWMKLTEVYYKYGAQEQLQTINKNFDMNVTEYVTVNWKTVAQVINELGGLDVELSEAEAEGINDYIDEVIESTGLDSEHVTEAEGTQHLDGVQAVTYCRLRKGLGDDYQRTERQRTVISLTLAAAKDAGIPKVLSVCNTVFPGISSSFSLTQIMALALGLGGYEIEDSTGFPFDQVSQSGGSYYIFPVTLASNVEELHEYLYGNTEYEPSGTVSGLSEEISAYSGYYGN
ncbi:MAG: LCP family protein [Lachnospiraceae bacterium]|nr:LCP family protein [Lachnospiraceae bacterium]